MLEIEIDGKKLTVPQGSTVMEAAHSVGTYIPHFCYHKKLSIAANCRMCLVEVEKAPKPLPACATPVTDGMKVHTHSDMAKKAQAGVMEFLLINHPLDCPICDQGGECQLQDLAVGYGNSSSRYQEEKRVVVGKDMGPLVSAEEMSRCIHCTRCVRFTEEVGGFQEIGMAHRGEFSEILPFLGKTVDSEISGNVIDLCPVGALTSKPFRYSTRAWELSRRKSVSPHDGLGSNLIVQVKSNEVMRVLPLENEAINECWIADRDRFSYEGLNSAERLKQPMIKFDGKWHETDWETALNYVVKGLNGVSADHGKDAIGFLTSPHSTTEELYLAQKLARAFGVESIDYRLRRSDFAADAAKQGAEWLGSSISDLAAAKSVLVVGSTLRKEQPLLTSRLRTAAKKGSELNIIHVADDDLLIKINAKLIVSPLALVNGFAQVLKAVAEIKGGETSVDLSAVEVSAEARRIAESLSGAETAAVVLGNVAQHHPAFGQLLAVAQEIARLSRASFGVLSEAANSVGAELAGALPQGAGANAAAMIAQPKKAYVLLNTEVEFDSYNPQAAVAAMKQAATVIALTAFKGQGLLDYADVLLPIAPFSETAGSFVNMEGKLQSFNGVVRPLGEARPAWKVLRVLGNMLNLSGFEFNSAEEVRAELLAKGDIAARLNNALGQLNVAATAAAGLSRIGEVPLYQADAICRRAKSLQQTRDAAEPVASAHSGLLQKLGIAVDSTALLSQGSGQARVRIVADDSLPQDTVRIATAHAATLALGGMFDAIEITQG
ncbi:NADH-quinone oxidoreductase subunit G [Chromobacterium haemolyticum]|uniref:NADH-quinone oxidoreductase n=1 Tax=Chromobacterium haemolyticum TaxID=394935 RepID=A0ABS3GST4_9NEIS|nr:NADH-quinone oxidoreductase subunit NuoG [Chromobacterium haemolyticum]MBK0416397.1 NADH-quinone oxidoreductase subunit G [Chromobacterium haemolyticum]MBO0417649.1 NADH-quinone oxidoreductase subunit G [Chromobacterium haemolyticum]MBO0500841.1 NADH-quinone oxidoreductase subunit G [Chromobacterium haemolyticum]